MIRQDQIPAASFNLRNCKSGDQIRESRSFSDDFQMFSAPYLGKARWLNYAKLSDAAAPFYGQLRLHFECIATEPMPDRLVALADKLQAALDRGDLSADARAGR
jgi:hypothetical protein